MILLTAEVKELKANPNRNARGLVIEAELDKGKGRLRPSWYRKVPCMSVIRSRQAPATHVSVR